MLTWLKSSLPTLRNLSKSNRNRLRPSCAACQSRRRRQQVIPLQKPTSWDSAAPGDAGAQHEDDAVEQPACHSGWADCP